MSYLNRVPTIDEGQSRFLDIIIKCIGGLFALILFFRSITEFRVSKEREFKIEVFKEQIDIAKRVVFVTEIIANSSDTSTAFFNALQDLQKIRTNSLVFISDEELNGELGEFYSLVLRFQAHSSEVTQSDLQTKARKIANKCKNAIFNLTKID